MRNAISLKINNLERHFVALRAMKALSDSCMTLVECFTVQPSKATLRKAMAGLVLRQDITATRGLRRV